MRLSITTFARSAIRLCSSSSPRDLFEVRGVYLIQAPKDWGGLGGGGGGGNSTAESNWPCEPQLMAVADPPIACQLKLSLSREVIYTPL